MKKFLSILICLIMASSCVAMATSAESTEKVLKDFFARCKDILFLDDNAKVEVAFLADVDNDKEPELIVSADPYFYGLAIYKVKEGTVKLHDKITCERGTGINENYGFIIDDNGLMCLFKAKTDAQIPSDYTIYTYTFYNLGKSSEEPEGYVSVNVPTDEDAEEAYYTSSDEEKTVISVSEAEEWIEGVENAFSSGAEWSREENSNYIDLETIWNKQKALINGDTSVCITLQIGNSDINVNGEQKTVDEENVPFIKNDRTLVPEEVVEALGGTIYKSSNGEIAVGFESSAIHLAPESNIAIFNGKEVILDVTPEIVKDKAMLPIRFIAETLGAVVEWNGNARQVTITKN